MNRSIMALVGVAGIASIASAQDFMKLDVQVSKDGGSSWLDEVSVNPGDSVMVRFLIDWSKAGAVAWGGTTLTQLNVANSAAGDTASDFVGRIQPGTQTFSLFNAGTANAKIDRLDNPAGSIQMAQLPLNNGGVADKPIVALSFKYNVSGDARTVTLDAPASNMTLATLFTSAGGSSTSIASAGRLIDGARINVVPAPGAMALLGAGALVSRRRRR